MRRSQISWTPHGLSRHRPQSYSHRPFAFAAAKHHTARYARPVGTCHATQTYRKTDRRCMSSYGREHLGDLKQILRVSDEVTHAIATNKPVVALESTIYTHGALGDDLGLEDVVRQHGGVPAVIGILDGVPTVGLTPKEVQRIVHDGGAMKVSRRDIAYLVGMGMTGRKLHGGTTIAGTMILARLAGIRVFGTGGLGGVHRGGHDSLDISADLTELGRTRVAVVSSGCKGFLDIPRTLEFLETQGVHVSTFSDGRHDGAVDFPAFWARESGSKSPSVVQDEKEAAAMILSQERLGIESGLLFANPIPKEFAIPGPEMASAIELAVQEASEKGYAGSTNTPYILTKIRELTGGRSVPANKELVKANVARATKVASELSVLLDEKAPAARANTKINVPECFKSSETPAAENMDESPPGRRADILVAGSVALDLSCDYVKWGSKEKMQLRTSNPACIRQAVGGVGHNVALAAHLVSVETTVRLCSLVGDDEAGRSVMDALGKAGIDTSYVRQLSREYHTNSRTAQYVAVNDADKNLLVAMADMGIFTHHSFPEFWKSAVAGTKPLWLVVDGNWSEQDIRAWIQAGRENGCSIAFEPVSNAKSTRLFRNAMNGYPLGVYPHHGIDLATPNGYELRSMCEAAKNNGYLDQPAWFSIMDSFGNEKSRHRFAALDSPRLADQGIPLRSLQLLPYIPTIITKLGSNGVLLATILHRDDPRLTDAEEEPYILSWSPNDHSHVGGVYMRLFPAAERVEDVVSVNGVGDTFLGVLIAGLAKGGKVENLIDVAQKAAVMTLKSHESVSPDLGWLEGHLAQAVEGRRIVPSGLHF